MSYLLKAKGVGDFGYVPVGLFKQDLCLLDNAAADDMGSSFTGIFF